MFRDTKTKFSQRYPDLCRIVLETVAADPTVHGILFFPGIFNSQDGIDPTDVIVDIADRFNGKPIVCVPHGRNPQIITKLEKSGRTVVFPSVERAVRALGRLRQYAASL